jgi:hypothetical protein
MFIGGRGVHWTEVSPAAPRTSQGRSRKFIDKKSGLNRKILGPEVK